MRAVITIVLAWLILFPAVASAQAVITGTCVIGPGPCFDALFPEFDPAARDATHVEQVVDETSHLADLTLR